jgi:4-azaleucine resistance transporter AzlC
MRHRQEGPRGGHRGAKEGPDTVDAEQDGLGVRRRILSDGLAIVLSLFAFGMVFGLAAREAAFSLVEALSMSLIAYSGAAQFAAVGLVANGVPWLGIVVLTALLNARHMLYAASLAPWFGGVPRRRRAVAAHFLTDEVFALVMPGVRALGRLDLPSYTLAAVLTITPWVTATAVGYAGGQLLPDPRALGLDIVFPAAMAGLAVALVTERRSLVAAVAGGSIGLAIALTVQPSVGVIAGGLLGPLVAMVIPDAREQDRLADPDPLQAPVAEPGP